MGLAVGAVAIFPCAAGLCSFESHIAHTLRADAPATILHRKRVHVLVEVGSRGGICSP